MREAILLALLALLLPSTGIPEQERTGGPVPMTRDRRAQVPVLGTPLRLSGAVLQIDTERRAIQIQDRRNKREVGFQLDPKCKIKADKKQFGKAELELDEIVPGYEADLIVRQADRLVIEMKIKKPKQE